MAAGARATVEEVNKTYGADFPTRTKFADVVTELGISDLLSKATEAAPTAEPLPLTTLVEDSKDGAELAGRAVFDEYEAPAPARDAKPRKVKETDAEPAKE